MRPSAIRSAAAHRIAPAALLLAAATLLAPAALAADEIVVSGHLSRVVLNPDSSPNGRGAVTLRIAADRSSMTYRITYAGIRRTVTAVHFCSGSNPREVPIPITCAFVIPAAKGGASPIVGSVPLVPAQADVLASGFAVIELASAAGPEISGYIAIGPPLPDTSTVPALAAGAASDAWPLLPVALAALAATAVAWLLRPARSRRSAVSPRANDALDGGAADTAVRDTASGDTPSGR
jgi:hypothetical protein